MSTEINSVIGILIRGQPGGAFILREFTGGRLYFRVALAGDKILDGAHMAVSVN